MKDKRQISKRYLIIYTITIIFTIIYSSIFLITLNLLVFSRFWFIAGYFLPIFIGSIRILFALIPHVKRKKDNLIDVCTNNFIENTKTIASKLGSTYPKKIYIIYDTNGSFFNPIIIIEDEEFDLYSIINENFYQNNRRWNDMLLALSINEHEQINYPS